MIETGFTYLRNMLAKIVSLSKTTPRLRTASDGNAKQFNWKMATEPISLFFSANNNKVCFIWIKL